VRLAGRELVNFSANDYLGLSRHPLLVERAREWAARWGAGAGASKLVTGHLEVLEALEQRIARAKGSQAALVFASGWQCNASALPALLDPILWGAKPAVFADRLNHASLHLGCQVAGVRQHRFRHNDFRHLEALLAKHGDGPKAIVTESVFSMDGDVTDVAALAALAERHDALLYVDEAHATGVLGKGGFGLSVGEDVDVAMGTFSKAMGSFGAYVACSHAVRDWLVNRASGLIYATALPPAVLGAIDAAMELVPTLEAERRRLAERAAYLRSEWAAAGLDTGASATQIVPVILGDERRTLAAAAALEERGLLGIAIRPPTVPAGTSRIRFALSAAHADADIERLAATMIAVTR
jgi:8-amino-7-oxononanoate synthase